MFSRLVPFCRGLIRSAWRACGLCLLVLLPGLSSAAPLQVVGRFLQDAHGNKVQMRGVNLPVYKSGYADDLDAVAAAIAKTKTNAVRLEWWANPPAGTTAYTVANLDRAIQTFYELGILTVIELHDLTYPYGHDAKIGPLSDGNDQVLFANVVTAFWTRADVLAVLLKHQDHLVINLANEWGSSFYSDGSSTAANFIQNYSNAMQALRAAGITAPLMVDAPKGFEHGFLLNHGQSVLEADPLRNTLLSVHAYWAATSYTDAEVIAILDALRDSQLPLVLGEVSSQAWTTLPCDPVHYVNLLTRANAYAMGYLFWSWYEDGQCGQLMNITLGSQGDGVSLPTAAQPGFGYDALYHPAIGIDTALPETRKADFSPVGAGSVTESSFNYTVTSTDDGVTRSASAQLTRPSNLGAEKRPVVVFLPGWGGSGDVAATRTAQAVVFAAQGYVAMDIGFHQTQGGLWYSDLAQSVKAALDVLCAQSFADCSAVVLVGTSYGGTQTHPVIRYLRATASFDGSAGANQGRKVIGFLAQDAGYTLHWAAPVDADATAYSIAMIENLGDADFPVDGCAYGNCGARNRADTHKTAPGSNYVLSYCPAGGSHGSRQYADWDIWVLSAVKTMLHTHRAVPTFPGYAAPLLAVSNACVTSPKANQTVSFGPVPRVLVGGTGTLSATASSGLPVLLRSTSGGVCSLQGQLVTGLAVGLCVITADQAGDVNFNPAPQALLSFSVSTAMTPPGAPVILSATPGPGKASFVLAPPTDTGGGPLVAYAVSCSASGQATVAASHTDANVVVTGLKPGLGYTCSATVSNASYTGATASAVSVTPRPLDLAPVWMLLLD